MYGQLVSCREGKSIPLNKTLIHLGKRTHSDNESQGGRSSCCELSLENNKWIIRQLDSDCEIRINGHPVQAAELNNGDLVAIGKRRYRLELAEQQKQTGKNGHSLLSVFGFRRKKNKTESNEPPVLGVLVPCRGGQATPLRKNRNTVGRDQTCDVIIHDQTISGLHCGLEYAQGHWKVLDLGSTNGLLVNGVAYRKKWLMPGDELMISLHRFRIEYHPAGDLPDQDDIPYTGKSLTQIAGIGDKTADRIALRHQTLEQRTSEVDSETGNSRSLC